MSAPYAQRSPRIRHRIYSRLGLWCALGSLLGSGALAGCSLSLPGAGATATPAAGAQLSPAWQAVLQQIGPNGEVSLATALQAYTLVFGPLPGVQSPAPSSGSIPSGTLAMRMILRHYSDLTPAQQQAVLQSLGYTAPASAQTPATGAPTVARAAQARPLALPRVVPALPTPVPTDAPGTADYRALLNEFMPKFNAFLSYTLTLPVVLAFNPKLKKAEAETPCFDTNGSDIGPPVLCRIDLNSAFSTYTLEEQRLVIAHELFHCYQAALIGRVSAYDAGPDWLLEGSAEWAGTLVSGATVNNWWILWVSKPGPGQALFARAYDAIGFFSLLDQAGISPWSVLPAMLKSQSAGPNNVAAYQLGTKPAPQEVLDEWASSYERAPSLGLFWTLTGPALTAASAYGGPVIHNATLANGGQTMVTTPAYTAIDYHLTATADVVLVNISGTSRLHDSAHVERVTSANGSYCTKQGGCTCPPGSTYQGPPLPQVSGLLHLAVTGGQSGATGAVHGLTLAQFCAKKLPPITQALCQQLLSLDEANAIMHPAVPATSIVAATIGLEGSCSYEAAPGRYVVTILFVPFPLGTSLNTFVQAALAKAAQAQAHWTITTTPVSGVGDQAIYVSATAVLNLNGSTVTYYWVGVVTTVGRIAIACDTTGNGSAAPPLQAPLTQVCSQVVSRLDP